MSICFTPEDLELFQRASGDRNPLHNDAVYARGTSFGQPVVFGALGTVACLGALAPELQRRVTGIRADFHRPQFTRVRYGVELSERSAEKSSENSDKVVVRLKDGSVPVLTATFSLGNRVDWAGSAGHEAASFAQAQPLVPAWSEIRQGTGVHGLYYPDSRHAAVLADRWNATHAFPTLFHFILWSSYLIGMEMPGRNALFFSAALELTPDAVSIPPSPFRYSAIIKDKNEGRSQLRIVGSLTTNETTIGTAQLTAFYRSEIPAYHPVSKALSPAGPLRNKKALLIGGSRGFGAALAVALAHEGAHVQVCSRSAPDWLQEGPPSVQQAIEYKAVDAANAEELEALRRGLAVAGSQLDFLVLLACPPIPSLRLEANGRERIRHYLDAATDLVLGPLCIFLPELAQSAGCLVLVSSAAVDEPVREWPHYVAAKASAEALVRVAAQQYPEISTVIFRPDRMLTEMTNTPMGRIGAASPHEVALDLVQQLCESRPAGSTAVLATRVPA